MVKRSSLRAVLAAREKRITPERGNGVREAVPAVCLRMVYESQQIKKGTTIMIITMKSNHLAGKGETLAALLVLCLSWMLFSGCSAAQSGSTPAQAGADGRVLRVGMECAYAPNNWEEAGATETNLPIINNEGFYAERYDVQIAGQRLEMLYVAVIRGTPMMVQACIIYYSGFAAAKALMPGASITERVQFNEIPPHVEYSFTQKGRDLMPVFYAMMNWGFAYDEENEAIEKP